MPPVLMALLAPVASAALGEKATWAKYTILAERAARTERTTLAKRAIGTEDAFRAEKIVAAIGSAAIAAWTAFLPFASLTIIGIVDVYLDFHFEILVLRLTFVLHVDVFGFHSLFA